MIYPMRSLLFPVFFLALLAAPFLCASDSYSPFSGKDYPRNVYWGDTHLHSKYSVDAYIMGNRRFGPEQAYRFALGEEVEAGNGMKAKINRPLDFLLIADHAEYLGLLPVPLSGPVLNNRNSSISGLSEIENVFDSNSRAFFQQLGKDVESGRASVDNSASLHATWQQIIDTADRFNRPGSFTTLLGFEWSAMPEGRNLHRVVVFRDDADKVKQILPFSAFDSMDVEALWSYLARYEQATGGSAFTIAHNGNLSNGAMFPFKNSRGQAITRDYADSRSRWEPLYEVTQMKGDSESHPLLSPADTFADFETWDKGSINGLVPKQPWMLKHEYAREALKQGLRFEEELGNNPFKFGMIGSTDAHTGIAGVEESNYWGKFTTNAPGIERSAIQNYAKGIGGKTYDLFADEYSASGYAAVWATENTRAAIFDAMQRREVYATTGPRIHVRFFGGFDFDESDMDRPDFVDIGYGKGVPMGGDLGPSPDGEEIRFLISAQRDPAGANLDRIQVIKGWIEENGLLLEKVYDVAWSDGRELDAKGTLSAVGSTVDLKNATWLNTIGSNMLATVWRDPDFDPKQRAFYYLRVIQIPSGW